MSRRLGGAFALLFMGSLALSACSGGHTPPSTQSTSTTAGGEAAGQWSRAIPLAAHVDLSVVSCPSANFCLAGSTTGQSYRLTNGKSSSIGSVGSSPSPQGTTYLTCSTPAFCVAVPNLNQVVTFNGTGWSAPTTISGAQGFTAVSCVGTTFCVSIDGEGNSFVYNGARWSGNVGAWGAANQISCVSPSFCIAAEGGPSVWDGHTWTQPNDADAQGQLNSVSCVSSAFCEAVDSSGDVLAWNGTSFSTPVSIATEPPLSGTNGSGLTGVSCASTTFCVAVDSIGRAFVFNGSTWTKGSLIDTGGALTSVSCASTTFCVAVDHHGNAYVFGGVSNT